MIVPMQGEGISRSGG